MSAATLPTEALTLVRALARGKAILPIASLPRRWGLSEEDAAQALSSLVALDLAEVWNGPGQRPSVVLSTLAVAELHVEIATTPKGDRVWVRSGNGRDSGPGKPIGHGATLDPEAGEYLDTLPDLKGVDPANAAELADEYSTPERKARRVRAHSDRGRAALPTVLLGLRVIGWTPDLAGGGQCPGCHGRKLGILEYCLVDDRSGAEFMLPGVRDDEKPKRYNPTRGLAGGVEHVTLPPGRAPRPARPEARGNRPRNKPMKRGRRK